MKLVPDLTLLNIEEVDDPVLGQNEEGLVEGGSDHVDQGTGRYFAASELSRSRFQLAIDQQLAALGPHHQLEAFLSQEHFQAGCLHMNGLEGLASLLLVALAEQMQLDDRQLSFDMAKRVDQEIAGSTAGHKSCAFGVQAHSFF